MAEMTFKLSEAIPVLERTPEVLKTLLSGLPNDWIYNNEGPETWRPFDVMGHLIHGEKTDWIPRTRIILSNAENKTFETFDRFAQFKLSQGKTLEDLIDEFAILRKQNLDYLKSLNISLQDLTKTGTHPQLGVVTLRQLLATWVVHDLGHIVQVSRVMARQYKSEIGVWTKFFSVMQD